MNIIAHRINKIEQLKALPNEYGAEVDIRSKGGQLIIHHDPFSDGEDFEEWVKHYNHDMLILNVKEEGLEARLIKLMNDKEITNYFFLDQSFPFLIKWSKAGERRCAVRVSEYEPIETALVLSKKIDWVWVDCFSKFASYNKNTFSQATLCINMDRLTVSLLTGSYGGLTRVLEAAHCATVLTDISTGTVKIQGNDKRVSEVTRILLELITEKKLYWSIVQNKYGNGQKPNKRLEVHVVIGKQYRERAKKMLIGEGSAPTELRDIENMSGATLKFEPNRTTLKIYIQSKKRSNVQKAQNEIEHRLLSLGIDTPIETTTERAQTSLPGSPIRSTPTKNGELSNFHVNSVNAQQKLIKKNGAKGSLSYMQGSPSFMQPAASPNNFNPNQSNGMQSSNNTYMQAKMMHERALHSSGMGGTRSGVGGVGGNPSLMTRLHPLGGRGGGSNDFNVTYDKDGVRLYMANSNTQGFQQQQQYPPVLGGHNIIRQQHQQHPSEPFYSASSHNPSTYYNVDNTTMNRQQQQRFPQPLPHQNYVLNNPKETRIASDEFLDECQTALCRAFQSDAATGDDMMCWSILQYASRGTQWRIEPGENSWT